MSVLESFEAADASLLEEIKEQEKTEEVEQKQPKDTEEIIEETTEESSTVEDAQEEDSEDDDGGETATVDEDAGDAGDDDVDEGDEKDNAKKGWKVRQELKAAKEKSEALEKRLNDMEGTLTNAGITKEQLAAAQQQQLLQQQQQQQKQEKEAEPDRDLDPDEWNKWKFKQQDETIAQYQQALAQQQQLQQLSQAREELKSIETNYQSKEYAQYVDAKEFLTTSYRNELKLQYPQATDAQLDTEIGNQELILASNAVNGGMNPAEAIKRMAEARGFIAKKGNTVTKKKQNISKMAQNQKRSTNLINKSGDTKKDKLTADDVIEMSLQDRLKMTDQDWNDSEVAFNWRK